MNLTVNYIPQEWQPHNKLAFMNWMQKIQSNHYKNIQ